MTESRIMRRIVVSAYGGPEQLRIEPVAAAPHPRAGELLIEVEAAGINFLDVYHRNGFYGLPLPFSPGLEGVGRAGLVRDPGRDARRAGGPGA